MTANGSRLGEVAEYKTSLVLQKLKLKTNAQLVSLYEGVMTFPINYTELKAVETQ